MTDTDLSTLFDKLIAEWEADEEKFLNEWKSEAGVGETLGKFLSRRMKEIDAKKEAMRLLDVQKGRLHVKFKEDMKVVEDRIRAERTHCAHPLTKFHNDPSGGSDSHTECLVCGASV